MGCNCKSNKRTSSRPSMTNPIEMEYQVEVPTNVLHGKSAYEYAVEGGYDGSEEQFYSDIARTGQLDASKLQIGERIVVDGGPIGGYRDGDVIKATDTILKVFKNIFNCDPIPPTYYKPEMNIVTDLKDEYESGDEVNLDLDIEYIQNDGGPLKTVEIKLGGVVLASGQITHLNKDITIPAGRSQLEVTVEYLEGPIKKDSKGQDYPEGRIMEGSLTYSKEVVGIDFAYMRVSPNEIDLSDPSVIKTWEEKFKIGTADSYKLPIPEGTKYIVIAYPSSVGEISAIIDKNIGFNVKDSFELNQIEVGTTNPVSYNFYQYQAINGLDKDNYVIEF